MLNCKTPWTHEFGWPQKGRQTCLVCGQERKAILQLKVNPRFDIPRFTPRPVYLQRRPA
jgi:hypothetical protein